VRTEDTVKVKEMEEGTLTKPFIFNQFSTHHPVSPARRVISTLLIMAVPYLLLASGGITSEAGSKKKAVRAAKI
jgi:hypothetical protein